MKLRALTAIQSMLVLAALTLTGCGMPANPQPPSLNLPQPVKDLTAARTGDEVHLHWTMPKRTTDKVNLSADQRVHICRQPAGKPCEIAGDLLLAPDKGGDFTDVLPPAARQGNAALLTYFVELRNKAGRSAGLSNPAWTASGGAPAPLAGLSAKMTPQGILLSWQEAPGQPAAVMVRIHRVKITVASAKVSEEKSPGDAQPAEQTLIVRRNVSQALDRDAALDETYRYTVERVLPVMPGGHAVEIAGIPSAPLEINAHNVFPPGVPSDLVAVADVEGKAIDLSWTPDADGDLAGYIVYRSQSGKSSVRLSGNSPIATPSYRDTTVVPGTQYIYSISATDRDGNESARSASASETVPQ